MAFASVINRDVSTKQAETEVRNMTLMRLDPFRELDELQREFNRMFDRNNGRREGIGLAFAPAAELEENEDNYRLKLEVPGLKAEDIDIQATAEAVSVTGERKSQSNVEANKGTTRTEFRYGKFQRVINLPGRIDNQNVKADYKDGILTLELPKAESEKHKIVKVNLGA